MIALKDSMIIASQEESQGQRKTSYVSIVINLDKWLKSEGSSSKRWRDRGNKNNKGEEKYKSTNVVVFDGEVIIVYEDEYINLTNQEYEWVINSTPHFMLHPTVISHPILLEILGKWRWGKQGCWHWINLVRN